MTGKVQDPGQIVWTDNMSVGVDALDQDHMAIIAALQAVIDALDSHASRDEIDQGFSKLMSTVAAHFRREEQMLRNSNFPGAAYHIREHVWLSSTLFDIQYNRLHASDQEVRFGVREFLTTWLYGHVLEDDFAYRSHLHDHPDVVDGVLAKS